MLTLYITGVITLILRASYKYGEESEEDDDPSGRLIMRILSSLLWPILATPYIAYQIGVKERARQSLPEARVRRLK